MLIVSVIVQSNSHILQFFLHQMFDVSALLLDDALLNVLLQKWSCFLLLVRHLIDISQGSVATQLRCGEIFSDSIITNFLLILRVK